MRGAAIARRSAEPTPALRQPEPGRSRDRRRVQTALKLSDPGDAAEREAVTTARTVMRMCEPVLSPRAQVPMLAARAPGATPMPSKAKKDEVSPELTAQINSLAGSGRPLSPDTRSFLEPRFKANFAGVRIHTGGKAENLATRLGAKAFTYGRDVFFNAGAYQPDSPEGMELIAHELTHTIQQREVVQRDVVQREAAVTVQQRTGPQVQRGIVSEALDWIADKANVIPGFRLFTIVIGRNPINMSKVERSGANILRALIEFIPGGGLIVQALENHGIFEKGGKFIEEQFAALGDLGGALRDALMEFIDSLGWRDIFRLGSLWDRAKRIFTVPVDKAIDFGKNLVSGIAKIVKDAIIKPLGRWAANNIPKWNLLVGVFGKNPISDEGESPASALIGGFMELIGQQEIWENIKKGNAVAKAWAWFQGAMKGALSLVLSIPGRVMSTIRSLTIFDIVTLVGAFQKIVGAFSSFVGDFITWAGGTVLSLLEIIFSVVAPSVVPYLKKAGGAFSKIIKAPGTFISTLVKAGKQGFNQFKLKFAAYLRDALFKWLLGSAEGAGIYFPKSFAPLELLKMGLSVLGLTWANLRAKLVTATSEPIVKTLETGFELIKTLITQGPAAAWEELLKSLSNLKNMVIDAAIDFVKGEVVKIAIEKLVSFLTPAGAFIQAIISIYRTIQFVVNKLAEIGRLVAAFVDGIAALANGVVGTAANKVESVLATGLSLAISFLANFAGLGNIPRKVMDIIKKIRAPVDKAMDKVVTWVIDNAKKLGKLAAQAGVPQDPVERLKLASRASVLAAKVLSGRATAPALEAALAGVKLRYALTSITVFKQGRKWRARARINPELAFDILDSDDDLLPRLSAAFQRAVVKLRPMDRTQRAAKRYEIFEYEMRQEHAGLLVETPLTRDIVKVTAKPSGKDKLRVGEFDIGSGADQADESAVLATALSAASKAASVVGPRADWITAQNAILDRIVATGIVTRDKLTFTPTPEPKGQELFITIKQRRSLGVLRDAKASLYLSVGSEGLHTLYKNRLNGEITVQGQKDIHVQKVIWRAITPPERALIEAKAPGIFANLSSRPAKRPGDTRDETDDPIVHVTDATRASEFTSATTIKDARIINRRSGRNFREADGGLVEINLAHIAKDDIYVLASTSAVKQWGFGTTNEAGRLDAIATREILIRGGIPAKAIISFKPGQS